MNNFYDNINHWIIIGIIIIFVILGYTYYRIERKKKHADSEKIIQQGVKFTMKYLLVPILVSVFIFIETEGIQNQIRDETNQMREKENKEFQKDNAPLIINNKKIEISLDNQNLNLNLKISYKQGNVSKAGIYFFKNHSFNKNQKYDSIKYIPFSFDQTKKDKALKAVIPIKTEKAFIPIKTKKSVIPIKTEEGNIEKQPFEYAQTMQFCMVIKDYKGNITKKYYVIRPAYHSKLHIKRTLTIDNRVFTVTQNCSNILKEINWNVDLSSNNSIKYDLNILKNSNDYEMCKEHFSPKFELATKNEQKLEAKKWKEVDKNNKDTNHTLADYQPAAVITASPMVSFDYYMPKDNELMENMKAVNTIVSNDF